LDINVKPLLKLELDPSVSHDYDTVLAGQEAHSIAQLKKARAWAKRLDVANQKGALGHAFVNGKYFAIDDVSILSYFLLRIETAVLYHYHLIRNMSHASRLL
jgi:hypothetical protein